MTDGRDVFYDEAIEAAEGLRAGRTRRRAPALHPLHLGLDGEAEGDPAHHRRLPDRGRGDPQARLRPEARRGRLLVRGRRRLGHRPHLHRLRPAAQRRDLGDVGGRARLPRQGRLVGAHRALRGDDLLHGADRDPRLHEVGRRVPGQARPLVAAAAGHGRRADQPEGVAVVLEGDRRRRLPDRRHLVADRDRPHHDHDAAGRPGRQARFGGDAAARDRRRRPSTRTARRSRARRGCWHWAAVAGDAADAVQGGRPLHGDLLLEFGKRPTSSATPRARTTTATSGSSDASTTSSTSPATGSRPPRSSRRSSPTRRSPSAA